MLNTTRVSYFILSAYFDTRGFKYLLFLLLMCLYVVIVGANLLLIVVICANRSLHEPMYMFLCSLFVNELYGSSGVFPFLLLQILSDVHTVPASLCFLQIFCLYCYACVEFFNLTAMSYDRYLAICCPLQYNKRMTSKKIALLLSVSWIYASVMCFLPICLTLSLQLCGNTVRKVYCDNFSIVKLACSDTTVRNVYGLAATVFVVSGPACLIFYTYVKILRVCFTGCEGTKQKAVRTCTPHLASLLNFSFGCLFEIMQSRFDMSHVPNMLRIFLSLYWLTCQPLLNPLLYGLNMSSIRNSVKSLMFS